jgi:hypothetical protein
MRERIFARCPHKAQADALPLLQGEARRTVLGALQGSEELERIAVESCADRRDLHAPGRSDEQAHPQFFLNLSDLSRERWLSNIDRPGRR